MFVSYDTEDIAAKLQMSTEVCAIKALQVVDVLSLSSKGSATRR